MFLIFLLTLVIADSIFSKGYKQMNGQINIETDIFDRINLTVDQRLIITLNNYYSHKLPLFLICRRSPQFPKIPDYFAIQNNQCVSDLNSYDFGKPSQKIVIEFNERDNSFMNIMQLKKNARANIIVVLEQRSDFVINFDIQDKNVCYVVCQNQGMCKQGQCECPTGFIGNDCSIEILDLSKQDELDPVSIYYLNITEQNSFRFDFNERCGFLFHCIGNNPFYSRGELLYQSFIEISKEDSQKCIEQINSLNEQFSLHLQPFYIFASNNQVEILLESSENSNRNTIIYIVTSIGLSLLLIVIFACFKCKKRAQVNNLFANSSSMSQKIALIRQMNKFMPIQTFEELIRKFPGLSDDQCCPICLENYQQDHKIRVSYCTHFFHSDCLDLWIEKNENCPTCRSSLNYETLNKLTNTENNDEGLYQNASSTKQISNYSSQKKIRLYGDNKSANSPVVTL
ncbi:unnamed protein product [Paramecium pentaurelia]|uniref:RING-type domain-containing protein n=1 Tax=Paramecium pentaurelia TaxID=43138 RepID=A0A8S1SPN3_9CILI|nr:unnamed protein product [Paramecium pentaurelia]